MSVASSKVYMCSGVNLNKKYEHSIYFGSKEEQREYFSGKVVKSFTAYSYLRKNWSLDLQVRYEDATHWNYCFTENPNDPNTYYYFVTNIEYVNDNMTKVHLQLDVIQTYLTRVVLLPSFVERMHTATDNVGEHTTPENLELGELVCNGEFDAINTENESNPRDLKDLCILVMATVNPQTGNRVVGSFVHGVFSGMAIYAVDSKYWGQFAHLLDNLYENSDAIINMWMYPKELVFLGYDGDEGWDDSNNIVHLVTDVKTFDFTVKKNLDIDGYTPKNMKLYSYPYNFLYATNNKGTSANYEYERFENGVCEFHVSGAISPDGACHMFPMNYKNIRYFYDEGFTLDGFPTCAWDADLYKIWAATNLNQNRLSVAMGTSSVVAGGTTAIVSAFTGNLMGVGAGVGMMVSGASKVAQLVAQEKDMQSQPPQARGTHSTSVNVAYDKQTFSFYFKSVNAEHARIIDDYFTMYGYKINRIETPRLNNRPAFTYIKTIDCQIRGYMCQDDIDEFQNVFDKGITFWMDGDKIGDYTQNNAPSGRKEKW